MNLRVTETCTITGRGLALFFDRDPEPFPNEHRIRVQVTRPNGEVTEHIAHREFARKSPPGEVAVFLLPGVPGEDVPVGSVVRVLEASV